LLAQQTKEKQRDPYHKQQVGTACGTGLFFFALRANLKRIVATASCGTG
jgi:hypothetical protein